MYPAVPLPSYGGVSVSVLLADLSSPFPCAAFPGRDRVVCCADCPSFVFPFRLLRFPVLFPSVTPLIRVSSRRILGVRLTHCSIHQHITQKRAALRHLHHTVLHINVGPYSQQASTARQAECNGAVVCSSGAVPLSFPLFPPSSFTERHARLTLPSLSLTPSIARGDVADVMSEFRRVLRWSCVFPTRRLFVQLKLVLGSDLNPQNCPHQ